MVQQLLQCCCRSAHNMPSRPAHLLFYILLLVVVVASSMEAAAARSDAIAGGLPLPLEVVGANKVFSNTEDADAGAAAAAATRRGDEIGLARRALIGSRPPRCERACMSCGHCEAVQVPIVPQVERRRHRQKSWAGAAAAAMFAYRVDGITNYKPLSWKCRCGGTILDP